MISLEGESEERNTTSAGNTTGLPACLPAVFATPSVSSSRTRHQQALIATVVVLTLATWFSATAVVPAIQAEWSITVIDAVWLTATVQVGFVLGALISAFSNLADRVPPHVLLGVSAVGAASMTAILAIFVDSLTFAVPLRLLTGVFMAGIYPVGMRLMMSWSKPKQRGASLGLLIGALTLGSALPHLVGALHFNWRLLLLAVVLLSLVGAVIALALIRPGPYLDSRGVKPNHRYVITMFRDREQLLINLGYFGHMWELYAMWTWLPIFVIASGALGTRHGGGLLSITIFLAIGVAGVIGSIAGGRLSDRFGRSRIAAVSLLISGFCCLASPAAFLIPWPLLLMFLAVWGASAIADSGIFSTLLSEATDLRYVGTALTAQTAIGFLVTVLTIQFVPLLAGWVGWQFAFLLLAVGPVVGVTAMRTLSKTSTKGQEAA